MHRSSISEMGNCFAFLQRHRESDDFTRLENLSTSSVGSTLESTRPNRGHSRHGSSGSAATNNSSGSDRSNRRHRNLQASSYVNQLYMNSAFGPGDELNASENKAVDEKRKARVRGLLEQIPVDVYVEGGKGSSECAICMGDFEEGDPIRFLPCMHSYHLQCIDDWLLRSFTCPSCMEPVDSALLTTFTHTSTNLASLSACNSTDPADISSSTANVADYLKGTKKATSD